MNESDGLQSCLISQSSFCIHEDLHWASRVFNPTRTYGPHASTQFARISRQQYASVTDNLIVLHWSDPELNNNISATLVRHGLYSYHLTHSHVNPS